MTSGITYNGVASADGGGSIFKDLRFWVALRVPTRKSILADIQNNGGVVVPLEKDADYCIADHLRKDAPSGSCSYEFITDSVRNGIIQVDDRYRIGPDPNMPKPIRTGPSSRKYRTAFTPADDAVLAKWVLEHQGSFGAQGGNAIYKDLEKTNDRHTWQSWRDRFVKRLRLMSDNDLRRLAATTPEAETEERDDAQNRPPNSGQTDVAEVSVDRGRERRAATVANTTNSRSRSRHEDRPPRTATEDCTAPDENNALVQVVVSKRNSISEENAISRTDTGSSVIAEDNASVEEDAVADEDMARSKANFERDLGEYMATKKVGLKLHHCICGRELELWDLFITTGAQRCLAEELDWVRVADDLGYDQARTEVIDSLQQCYKNNLVEFIGVMDNVTDEEDPEEIAQQSEESEGAAPLPPTGQGQPRLQEGDAPSSSPVRPVLGKRKLNAPSSSSGRSHKRRQPDRNTIIPSTPDEKPDFRKRVLFTETPSRSSRKSKVQDGRFHNSNDSEGRNDQTPTTPRSAAILGSDDNQFDMTPSQQLQSEAMVHSPIPIRFERGKGNTGRNARPANDAPQQTAKQPEPPQAARRAASDMTASARPQVRTRKLPASFRTLQIPVSPRQPQPQQQERQRDAQVEHNGNRTNHHEENRRQISHWIDHYESRGYPHHIVVDALRRTTLTPGRLVDVVMQSLQEGNGVPTHHEGIWTDRDDASLRLVDSANARRETATAEETRRLRKARREWERLVHKHGQERIELRRGFLEAEAALDEEATRRDDDAVE